jgi:mRNA interferase MazF
MPRQINHGEVWLADLNPGRGAEPGKMRPVLIFQNQALLDALHPSTVIIPLTTNLIDGAEPLRIRIKAQDKLERDSDLLIDQIRAIDNRRLIQDPLCQMEKRFMGLVYEAVSETLGISPAAKQRA